MATDPLQSGPFGVANGGPVADPFDFTGITTTPQTTAENVQDPFNFTGIPSTPYVPPTVPNIYPVAADPTAIEQVPVWTPGRSVTQPADPDNPPADPDNPPADPDNPPVDTSWWKDHLPGFTFDPATGKLSLAEGYDQGHLGHAWGEFYEKTNLPRGELGGGNYIDRVEGQDEAGDSYYTYTLRHGALYNPWEPRPPYVPPSGTMGTTAATTPAATTPAATTPAATTPAEWTANLPTGMRYSGGRLGVDPAYSTGDPSGRRYGWSYSENAERDVFNRNDYLAAIYERMYGRHRGQLPVLGGGYGISRETMEDDGSSWDQYSITGPNMAAGGVVRRPSYLSGGIGSLGSTYLR